MEQELILWFWRGLLTLGMGGVVRLLIWQRKIERELAEQKVKTDSAAGLGAEIKKTVENVTRLNAAMDGFPAVKNEISACHRRLDQVANSTSELTGEVKQMNNILHLIQEHLMRQSK